MLADLPTCEWSPGSNRSLVPASVAVARLDVPAADRPILVERLRRLSSFDDVVRIDWISIRGAQPHAYQYGPTITNMNFGPTGRLCRSVTRDKWSSQDAQSALVFVVNGRAYGFAAACGNLFELSLLPPAAPPPAAIPSSSSLNLESIPPTSPTVGEAFSPPPILPQQESVETTGAGFFPTPWAVAPPPTFDGSSGSPGFVDVPELPPIPAVPEPSILELVVGTLAAWRGSDFLFRRKEIEAHKALLAFGENLPQPSPTPDPALPRQQRRAAARKLQKASKTK